MTKIRQPTTTSLVLEALRATQEFMSIDMLRRMTERYNVGDVQAALHHLRKYHAVDVVVEKDGTGWWFATGYDSRRYAQQAIVPDIHRQRHSRKAKAK